MLTTTELNAIILGLSALEEKPHLPYCKGMVYKNDVVSLLKEFTDYGVE